MDLSGVGQGLYDKSSDKLCAPAQILPYEQKYKRKDKKHMRMNDKAGTIVQDKRRHHEAIKKTCLFMSQKMVSF